MQPERAGGFWRRRAMLFAMAGISLLVMIPSGAIEGQAPRTPIPATVVPDPPLPASAMLFEDDFSTYSRRWTEQESPKSRVAYRDGALTMRVVSPGVTAWSTPDVLMPAGPYRMEAALVFRAGSLDSWAGCLLAVTETPALLAFWATRGGDWQLQQLHDDDWETIAAGRVVRDAERRRMVLRVELDGTQVALWIDERLASRLALDEAWAGERIGLAVRAGRGFVDVAFEHVEVRQLAARTDAVSDD